MEPQSNDPSPDNYAGFLARLDAATASLSTRARALDKALAAISLLLGRYQRALRAWERRLARVNEELVRHSGEPQTSAALHELHRTAAQMESVHSEQVLRITEKLSNMQGRRDAIGRSLLELEVSRAKLDTSRRLSRDRENLSKALYELAGTGGATPKTPDLGLRNDLKEAREAVVLAEALIEVKGS
jgi:predicted  nucleic acid-binding Zn-ribbon protein